jgi:hypothetical protein
MSNARQLSHDAKTRGETIMITKTALAIAALLVLGVGAMSPAAHASGTISACGATVSTSGNYTVTANLTTASSTPCITITASNVAIDLGSHTITGTGSAAAYPGYGIADSGSCSPSCQQNIIIANGTITGFYAGIFLTSTQYATIANMNATQDQFGIVVEQDYAMVTESQASNNAGIGISLNGNNETISNSQANNNSTTGMEADGPGATISNSQASKNGGNGMAFSISGATVSNSSANNNGGYGMLFGGGNNAVSNSDANNNFVGMALLGFPGNNTVTNS